MTVQACEALPVLNRISLGWSVPESMWLHNQSAPAAFLSLDGTMRPLVNGKPTSPPMARGQDITVRRVGKKRAGRMLDGRTWDEYPEMVNA